MSRAAPLGTSEDEYAFTLTLRSKKDDRSARDTITAGFGLFQAKKREQVGVYCFSADSKDQLERCLRLFGVDEAVDSWLKQREIEKKSARNVDATVDDKADDVKAEPLGGAVVEADKASDFESGLKEKGVEGKESEEKGGEEGEVEEQEKDKEDEEEGRFWEEDPGGGSGRRIREEEI